MFEITFPVALTIIGSLGTVLTFFYRFFKKTEDPRVTQHEEKLVRMHTDLEIIKSALLHEEERNKEIKEKLGDFSNRLEKISDLIIELIKSQNS